MYQKIPGQRHIEIPTSKLSQLLLTLKPYVRQTGDEIRAPWFLDNRKLLDYLIVHIVRGKGHFKVADTAFDVADNSLVWIPPDTIHRMKGTSSEMHCRYIHFDLQYDPKRSHWDACIPGGTINLERYSLFMHPQVQNNGINILCGHISTTPGPIISDLIFNICLIHTRNPASIVELSALMLSLLENILKLYQKPRGGIQPYENSIRLAEAYLRENPDPNIDISKLAKRHNYSASHFRKLFRRTTGKSPGEVNSRALILKATRLLIYSSKNISQIADELGFSTVHNFSRAFKRAMNLSPTDYRKKTGCL